MRKAYILALGLAASLSLAAAAMANPLGNTSSGGFTPTMGGVTGGAAAPNVSQGNGAVANGTAGSTTNTPGAGSANCDYTAIKNSISGTESNNNYAASCARNPSCNTDALGKYQFISSTRSSYIRKNPQCNGANCDSNAAWTTAACRPVQECIMDAYLAESQDRIKKSPACQTLLNNGQTYTGSGQGKTLSCRATMSGLMGAMHLGGNGSDAVCRRILSGGSAKDSYGTSTTYYMCKHGGKSVPSDCTPAPYDGTVDQPAMTQQQIDEAGAQGIWVNPGGGPADPLKEWWVAGLQLMAEQFTVNMEKQIHMIGTLLDAKHQMETQRLMQQKMSEAHRDYHPSEQVCTFGTFARDLAATEKVTDVTKRGVANEIMQRELGSGETKGADPLSDSLTRINAFRKRFCNPTDNANGLKNVCPRGGPAQLQNRDINYTTTVDLPLSLKIDMTDNQTTEDEEAVFALIDNLFLHEPPPRMPGSSMQMAKYQYHYQNYRSLVAIRGIARNSIANIVALKTETPNKADGTPGSAAYMRRLLMEFGMTEDEIGKYLGENPSYYAQMEMLTKKLYQNPVFYAQLYDKAANVKRLRAAMQAVKLMQDRDIQAALQRREMLLSLMLELRVRERADRVYNDVERAIYTEQ